MPESKHTPGPWRYEPTPFGHPNNRINPIIEANEGATGVGYVCRVGWQGSTIPGMTSLTPATFEEAEANAKLIAASPDLLTALKDMLWLANDHEWEEADGPELDQARAAVDRAKGKR